jgi:hypothetical protein
MGQHRYSAKILPKFQDLDTDVRYVKQGGVRYMRNLRLGTPSSSNLEIVENIKSTLEVPFNILPSGKNKCIGSTIDTKNNRLIFLNYNSENNHCVYCYIIAENIVVELYKDIPDNVILDFVEDYKAQGTRIKVLDGKYLFWTDRYNAQRFLDIEKAIEYNKKKIWHVADNLSLFRLNLNNEYHEFYLDNPTNAILDAFDIEKCDCKYIFTEKVANTLVVENDFFIPQNFYPKPHNERQIDFILYPPHTAPKLELALDNNYKRNFLNNTTWQFRTRYKYKNGAYSVWSAWSKLINTSFDCGNNTYNCIDIDYSADIFNEFNDNSEFNLIDSVELGYRNTNIGELNKFVTIPQCEIPKGRQVYRFYNDTHAETQPQIDDVLQYDAIPLKSGGMNVVGDRIVLADNIEGYDSECFDFNVNLKFTPNIANKRGSLKVIIRIFNPTQSGRYRSNQPIIKRNESILFGGLDADGTGRPNFNDMKFQDEFGQYLPAGGFVGYLAGTDYFGISKQVRLDGVSLDGQDSNFILLNSEGDWENLDNALGGVGDNSILYSVLEIKDIPIGRYIFRLASHLCSYGSQYGSYYDLNNPQLIQQTSTNVMGVIPDGLPKNKDSVRRLQKEVIIDIVENQQAELPDFVIEDLIYIPRENNDNHGASLNGYVKDSGGNSGTNSTLEEFVKGDAVEGVLVTPQGFFGNSAIYTDHNGYFYNRTDEATFAYQFNFKVQHLFHTDKDFISDNQYVYGYGSFNGKTITQFYDGTAVQRVNSSNAIAEDNGGYCFGIPNYNPAVSINNRTIVKGKIVDVDGNGIAGIDYVVSGTNRIGKTDINGEYKFIVYPTLIFSRKVEIIFYSKNACFGYEFKSEVFNILNISSSGYNYNNHYEVDDIVYNVSGNIGQQFYLKNGGVYDFGVEELDRGNRKSKLHFNEKKHRIRLPFTTEKIKQYFPNITQDTEGNAITDESQADGYFTAEIELISKPSVWSTHLYTLRTEDQVYSDYLQFGVSDVKYVIEYKENEDGIFEPQETTFGGSNANEIYLNINTSFVKYKKRNTNSEKGWTYEKGDMLRFLYKDDGKLFDGFYEVEIKGQRGNWFIIDNIEGLPELKQGVVVEIFRLKQKRQSQLFYETAEYTKVEDRYLPTRNFRENKILLNTGDAYRRNRVMPLSVINEVDGTESSFKIISANIEDPTISDKYIGKDNDIGRPSAINDNNKQIHRPSSIRFGGKYIIGSNINELHRFIPTDIVEANTNYGKITIIEDFENILFVAQEKMCHIRYINKTRTTLGDGSVQLLDSSTFLSQPDYFAFNYGCTNPESFTRSENACFFSDMNTGNIIQYSVQNGIGNISGIDLRYNATRGQDTYVKKTQNEINKIPIEVRNNVAFIYGGYHTQEYNELHITFEEFTKQENTNYSFLNKVARNSNIGESDDKFKKYDNIVQLDSIGINSNTIAFDNRKNYWYGDRGYIGECYSVFMNNAFAFKDGRLYVLDKGVDYNTFFGVKDKSKLIIIMNEAPSEIKDFQAYSIESNKFWENIINTIPYNTNLGRKQESVTLDALVQNKNGIFYGAIQKDMLTIGKQDPLYNGNDMVGDVMLLEFENDNNERVELFAINVYAGYVGRTNF